VVSGVAEPVARALRRDGAVRRFFFVRYNLGGPHVRLRLEAAPGRGGEVAARVREAADEFFARQPSLEPLPDEAVRRGNRAILADDPLATIGEDTVYPDNSLHECPAAFEVERYGGPRLLRHSLEYFAVSSVAVMRFLAAHGGEPASGARLTGGARMVVRQAWGLAHDAAGFVDLLEHAVWLMGEPLARFAAEGERAFESRGAPLVRLIRDEIAELSAGAERAGAAGALDRAARSLAWSVRGAPAERRQAIAYSHLHMTSNRLGMLNPEEVYLGRMLGLAARALAAEDAPFWAGAWAAHRTRPARGERLAAMAAAAMDAMDGAEEGR